MEETFLYLDRETVKQYLKPEDVIAVIKELWTHWKDGSVREGEHSFLPIYSRERPRSCLLYTSPSPRDPKTSRMPSSA